MTCRIHLYRREFDNSRIGQRSIELIRAHAAEDRIASQQAVDRVNKLFESGFYKAREKEDIIKEIETGSHTLTFEYNNAKTAKCRAFKCLVEGNRQSDEKIRSPYRLNLEATQPSNAHWSELEKPIRRFYHVSCFEAIGVDTAKHVQQPPARMSQWNGDKFHPAIVDWILSKGTAFDADKYGPFMDALGAHLNKVDNTLRVHARQCIEESCVCGLPLEEPKSSDFIDGEPSERSPSEVLLHVIGAASLMPATQQTRIELLEVFGEVPEALVKKALAAEKQTDAEGGKEAESEQVAEDADGEEEVGEDETVNSETVN